MMLKQRLITASVLIPVIVIGIFYLPNNFFSLLLALFVCTAAWEWSKLLKFSSKMHNYIYVLMIICVIGFLYTYQETLLSNSIILLGVIWWIFASGLIIAYQKEKYSIPSNHIVGSIIGFLVLVPAWLSISNLHSGVDGPQFVLFLFILIWTADISAYFVGKKFGRRRLASRTSPGKTWEGVIGALIVTSMLSLAYGIMLKQQYAAIALLFVCFITVSFSIIGDLTESMFKRITGIKDSGTILPGHGGVLDRIDSLTAASPVYITGLWFLQGKL